MGKFLRKKPLIFILMILVITSIACKKNIDERQNKKIQDNNITKIVVYSDQDKVLMSGSRSYKDINSQIFRLLDFRYGIVKWADGGNREFSQNSNSGRGILVIFSKPINIKLEYKEEKYKRIYIAISGKSPEGSIENDIILGSKSEYSWDWAGLAVDKKSTKEFRDIRTNLKEIIDSLN